MTVTELIERLKEMPGEAEVIRWDSEEYPNRSVLLVNYDWHYPEDEDPYKAVILS